MSGTLGVLKQAKANGILVSVRPLLDAMRATNFRLDTTLYQSFLQSIGE
ncbi:MAG: DUF3368 domain-containing protein [Blastochloris sp.]|nr:DUF3368 domain-containing protein [Blastochloris sp.]